MTAAGEPNWANRTLWTGDNLDIMRGMNSASVDLIYFDPPFNSSKTYTAPGDSEASGAGFEDTWTPSDLDPGWHVEIADREPALRAVVDAAGQAHGESMKSYLLMMGVRLLEMRRLLRDTGSIYLHCDPTASHYLKIAMDCVFGRDQYRNEIVWRYGKMSNPGRNFPRNHDTILRYTKTDSYVFSTVKGAESEYRTRYARYLTGNRVLYGSVKSSRDKLVVRRVERLAGELGRDLVDDDVLFDFDREFKRNRTSSMCPSSRATRRSGWGILRRSRWGCSPRSSSPPRTRETWSSTPSRGARRRASPRSSSAGGGQA